MHRVLAGHPTPAEGRERAVVLDPYSQHPQLPRIAGGGGPAYGALPFLKRGDLRIITEMRGSADCSRGSVEGQRSR